MIPKIFIINQASPFQELITKNGVKKQIHYVVKNTPFTVKYGMENLPHGVNFKNSKIRCTLLFDLSSKKEVDFITKKPLEYVVFPSDDGLSCKIEFRVKVLTTQLEGSLFIIKTTLEKDDLLLSVETESIKSVSKPAQIRRKIAQRDGIVIEPKRRKKRKRSESAEVEEILKVQSQHSEMLKNLIAMVSRKSQTPYYYPYYATSPNSYSYVEAKPASPGQSTYIQQAIPISIKKEECLPEEEFEEKLKELVELYDKINPNNRKEKIRKIVSSLEQSSPSQLSDLREAIASDATVKPGTYFSPFENDIFETSKCTQNNLLGLDQHFSPSSLESLNEFCLDYIQGNTLS